jgi:YD repeat-containing protein
MNSMAMATSKSIVQSRKVRRLSMRFFGSRFVVRLSFSALVLAFMAGSALAQAAHPNKEKGFNPDRVYDFHAIDNVNTFNGNLVLTIPVGQRYAVNGSFSYGFSLVYNGMIWDAYGEDTHAEYLQALTSVRSNAGNGWIVSLGRLFAPKDPLNQTLATNGNEWVYESVDGRDHSFGNPTSNTEHTLSNDDDLIRMIRESDTKRRIEFPDGSTSVFQNFGSDETKGPWRLVQMYDRFNNSVYIRYELLQVAVDAPTPHADGNKYKYNEQWIVSQYANGDGPDTGDPVRTQRLYFHNNPADSTLTFDQTLLREADVTAFHGTTNHYLFDYDKATLYRPSWDNSKSTSHGYTYDDSPVYVYLLDKMTLDTTGESFAFDYVRVTSDNQQGSINRLQYPTGGGIRWTCQNIGFRPSWSIGGADQETTATGKTIYRDQNIGVLTRTLFDENGHDIVAANGKAMTWTYSRNYTQSVDIPITGTNKHNIFNHELAVAVVDPEGTANITYYSIYNPTGADSWPAEWETTYGWDEQEYAMPVTHWLNQPLHDGNSAGLSSEVRQNFTGFGDMTKDNPRAGGTKDASIDTFRTLFVRYNNEGVQHKQEAARHTSYDQDKTCPNVVCFSESFKSSPLVFTSGSQQGFIHYQQTTTYANFTTGDHASIDGNTKTTFTKYNPPTDAAWIMDTYTEQCVSDGAPYFETDPNLKNFSSCAGLTGAHKSVQSFCFDPTTGFLKRHRIQRDVQPQADDVLIEFTSEQTADHRETGNVAMEKDYGAVNGDVPTGTDLCTMSLGATTAAYTINNTYTLGTLSTSQYAGVSFYSTDLDIDNNTGLPTTSRDTSGVATDLHYDGAGRITGVTVPGSAPIVYTYHPFDFSAHTTPWVEATQDAGPTLGKTDAIFNFDALGRIYLERNLTADDSMNAKRTRYDAVSRKIEVSAVERYTGDTWTPQHVSTMIYDHFDRVRQATGLDGAVTKAEYDGEGAHRLTRTANIYTGNGTGGTLGEPVDTIENYNIDGKLVYIQEPAGPAGEDVKTYYDYDIADRLKSVDMAANETTQHRSFAYDNRGFLLSETHPEVGKSGNGTVTYGKPLSTTGYVRYDARGHALRKTEGGTDTKFDLELVYDTAERLTNVNRLTSGAPEPIKSFSFGQDNDGRNYKKGKLEQAVRHNRIDAGDTVVTETFKYNLDDDAGGRITERDTAVQIGTASPFQTFTQNFTYSPWGQVAGHTYPTCAVTCTTTPPGFVQRLNRTFHNGQLVKVSDQSSDWATFQYEANGFLSKITHVTASGDTSQTDERSPDLNGIPRPLEIKFKNYCVGPPVSSAEPSDKLIANKTATTLSVTPPAGAANPTYHWYQGLSGDRSIPVGSNTNTFTTPVLLQTTSYWVEVRDGGGCPSQSRTAHVVVKPCDSVYIVEQPHDTFISGSANTVSFAVEASDSSAHYQWYQRDDLGVDTPVGTSSKTLTLNGISSATSFFVRVTSADGVCSVDSRIARAQVCDDVNVTVAPQSQTVLANAVARISAAAIGPLPLTFTWTNDGNSIVHSAPDGTDTLEVTVGTAQTWHLTVSSGCGKTAPSIEFTLSPNACQVDKPMTIVGEPGNTPIAHSGEAARVSVTMDPPDPDPQHPLFKYEWFANDLPNPVATERETQITTTKPWSSYYVKVTDLRCQSTVAAAQLPVIYSHKFYVYVYGSCPIGNVSIEPPSADVVRGGTVTLTAVADFPVHMTYQWYKGQSGDTRTEVHSVADHPDQVLADYRPNFYWVRMTNSCGVYKDSAAVAVGVKDKNSDGTDFTCTAIAIEQQPAGAKIASGDSYTLAVDAKAVPTPLYYEWNAGPTPIATGKPYVSVSPAQSTSYTVDITSNCAATASSLPALVQVVSCGTNRVATQPASRLVTINQGAALTVAAVNPADVVTYQWYSGALPDTSAPVGTNSPTFITPALTVPASYWVRMTTANGCTFDSDTALLDICGPPTIKDNYTRDFHIVPGQYDWIGVDTEGTHVGYDWFIGSSNDDVSHPTGEHTNLIEVHPEVTTSYWVRVSNDCGTAKSLPILVSVCPTAPMPVAAKSPLMPGGTTTLSITPVTADAHYQWYAGEMSDTTHPIANSDTTSITTPPITADTKFWVRVTSGTCFDDSETVTVAICHEPAIVWQGSDQPVKRGQQVALNVIVSPVDDTTMTYYSGAVSGDVTHSTVVSGPTINQGIFVNPAVTTKYWTRAARPNGCYADTATLTLDVCVPTIRTQPQDAMVNGATPATLTVVADDAVSYQWYEGDSGAVQVPVANATSATLSISPTVTKKYWCQVKGTCGVPTNSAAATVTICQPATATTPYTSFQIQSGQSAIIGVNVAGTSPTLQWYQGTSGNTSTPLSGKTTTPITVSPAATTQYWARASNTCANGDGPTITVDVCTIPSITTQPANATVPVNGTAVLSVVASTSPGTVTYQWYSGASGDTSVPVGTNSSNFTTPAITADTQYWVRVTRGACSVNSNAATVYACTLLASVTNVQSKSGQAATLTAGVANNRATATYAWYRGNSGDTSNPLNVVSSTLTQSPVTTTNYWVRVNDGICTADSSTAAIQTCIPNITANPANVTINSGQQATLTVTATGDALSYQWYDGAAGVTTTPVGTNSSTLTVQPATTKTYWVKVTGCQSANSTAATVTICAPPTATAGPTLYQTVANQNVTIAVTVGGTPAPSIQWYQGPSGNTTTALSGKTTSAITVAPGAPTQYWARASNQCGNGDGPTITVDACSPPVINVQPATVAVTYNNTATLSVTATANGTITYQWYRGAAGDTSLPVGTSSSTYTTPPMTADTQYWVRLTRGLCTTDSNAVTVYACSLAASVQNVQTKSGVAATLVATVGSQRTTPTYTWYRGNSGDNSNPLNLFGAQITQTVTASTNYWVRVSDGTCTANSSTGTIQVCIPNITSNPANVTINSGQQTTLNVVATGESVSYQWYQGASGVTTTPVGTNSPSFTVQPASTTSYWVKVTGCQTANSTAATVTVCQLPTITAISGGAAAQPNTTTGVSVTATGTGLNYQWYQGLAGDTSHPVFTNVRNPAFTAVQTAYYWVRVSNTCGSVDSSAVLNSVYPQINSFVPGSTIVPYGGRVTESLSVAGTYLMYQWYVGDLSHPIAGATSASYTTPVLTQNASYICGVTSGTAVVFTPLANLTICTPPQLDSAYTQTAGTGCWYVVAAVNANDGWNVNYTWYKGQSGDVSSPVPGGTGNYITVCPTVTTSYWCRIWFNDGSCYKDTPTLTVH